MTAARRLWRGWGPPRTIRVRLTLWYVVLLAAILLGFSLFLYASLARNLRAQIDRSLAASAQRIADAAEVQDGQADLSAVELGDPPDELTSGVLVAVYGPSGEQLVVGGAPQAPSGLAPALAPLARGEPGFRTVTVGREAWRVLTAAATEPGARLAIVQVVRSERDVAAALRELLILILIAIPLTLLVAVAGGLFLAGRALDPIDRMTRAAARIGAEDLSRRLGFRGQADEVGRLATTFDGMLDRLEAAFERQRQFTADASHELRTPLAILAGRAEVALERPRTPDEYRRVLRGMREDVRRMSRLVGEMLTLARADAGEDLVAREPLDLAEVVTQVVAAMETLARARTVRLRMGELVPAAVLGDQTRLTQLLVNLVDNALKHTPAGGSVTISAAREPAMAVLRVADTGTGIDPDHLPHVFERFYRADGSRGRDEGGTGLGLAIGQWIARAHGGDIALESAPGVGTTVTVRLPLRGPEDRSVAGVRG